MNAMVGIVTLLIVAGVALALVLMTLWQQAQAHEDPVGPWEGPQPKPPARLPVPQNYLTMWAAEGGSWSRLPHEWERLVRHLDVVEVSLGGDVRQQPAPTAFDSNWLEHRLDRLERLAQDGSGRNGGRP